MIECKKKGHKWVSYKPRKEKPKTYADYVMASDYSKRYKKAVVAHYEWAKYKSDML